MARYPLGVLAALALFAWAPVVTAEPSEQDKTLATTLFNDAKVLLGQNKVAEACRKLEESRRLNPLGGTILNLAVCHEQEGLLASAASEFREARQIAERDHRDERVTLADQHLAALEPRLAKLVIAVDPSAESPQLRITRDGTPLGRAAWGVATPIDPGKHVIDVSAPGKKTRHSVVTVAREGETQTFNVSALDDEHVATRPAAPRPAERSRFSAPVIALGAASVVAAGVGTFFGIRAFDKHGDPSATCTTMPCSEASSSLNRQAGFAADASTVSFAVAGVALALAGVLFLIGPHSSE